jgi:sporulation protein YqfC
MEKKRLLQRMVQAADLSSEPIPGEPLTEIFCDHSVLIENHKGVTEYSNRQICVQTKFGSINVNGCNLELAKMTDEQLIIKGNIFGIELCRR